MAILRARSVWSAIWLGVVAFATVFWANVAFAGYPDGVRNPDEWYFCHSERGAINGVWSDWSSLDCEHLLWQDQGTGNFDSVAFEQGATAQGDAMFDYNEELLGYIVPAEGVKTYTYRCDVVVSRCVGSGILGQSNGNVFTAGTASNPFNGDDTEFNFGYPSDLSPNQCFTTDANVVGLWRASQNDNFSSLEPVTLWSGANTTYPRFGVSVGSATFDRSIIGAYSCQIVEWEMWGVDPWVPDDGDIDQPATPTPGAIDTTPISIYPVVPVTQDIDIDLGTPVPIGCYDIPPEVGPYTVTIPSYGDWVAHVEGIELCVSEQDFDFTLLGVDYGILLVVSFGLAFATFLVRTIFT